MTIFDHLGISKEEFQKIDVPRNYLSFRIKKSDGKRTRRIDAPMPGLKSMQKVILYRLLYYYRAHSIAHGFVKGRSPKTNAMMHLGKKYLLKFDIKDFFPTVTESWVIRCLGYLCGSNNQKLFDVPTTEDLTAIAKILCLNGSLPQGAPSSPALTNLMCYTMDVELEKMQTKYACTVTRYADDITVSLDDKTQITNVINQVHHLMYKHGYKINRSKLKVCSQSTRQKITGIVVNTKLNTPKESWRNLRAAIHQASQTIPSEKTMQQLRGKVEWLRSLNPIRGNQFLEKLGQIGVEMPLKSS
jgi:RNA-directed DNA polymerase